MSSAITYTVVQHSGFGYAGHSEWRWGLETRIVPSSFVPAVTSAGGVMCSTWAEAEDAAMEFMYPKGVQGYTPRADLTGRFAKIDIEGLSVFIPHPELPA